MRLWREGRESFLVGKRKEGLEVDVRERGGSFGFLFGERESGDGRVSETVCRYREVDLGAMGSMHSRCSCFLATWLGCQVLTCSTETHFQLSQMEEIESS